MGDPVSSLEQDGAVREYHGLEVWEQRTVVRSREREKQPVAFRRSAR
jgi:hypothetical protein